MTTPRHKLVDAANPRFYHIVSRCVRQSFLCGVDRLRNRDYSHRKKWLEDRIFQLESAFAVEVYAFAIMSNHFHLVLYFDPNLANEWSDEEVARRWLLATHRSKSDKNDWAECERRKLELIKDHVKIDRVRKNLGCLSTFMKMLKQPIAVRANKEDECKGHFFEKRFYSAALLDEQAVVTAMSYVDLNPIRAGVSSSLENSSHTSVQYRLKRLQRSASNEPLGPVRSDHQTPRISWTTEAYIEHLKRTEFTIEGESAGRKFWRYRFSLLSKKQRAYGSARLLERWLGERGMQHREVAFS